MKKIPRIILLTLLSLCFSVACFAKVEAATVALLPLINNIHEETPQANQVYYKSAIGAINAQKGFILVENEQLNKTIEEAGIGSIVPNKDTLMQIAKKGDVDIVIAMELNELSEVTLRSSEGDRLQLKLDGRAVAYNRLTNRFYNHRIYDDLVIPEAFSTRWEWTYEQWSHNVRREINSILQVKKIKLDKPRMSHF